MPRPPHIVFAGGGTPGHLHPGLAVAAHLLERIPDATMTFVGGARPWIAIVIRAAGFSFAQRALAASSGKRTACGAIRHRQRRRLLGRPLVSERETVSAVVGLGGASSAPTVRAAISRGIPTVMLEQNVVPGRVTRWLARSATTVCAGFNETRGYFPSAVPLDRHRQSGSARVRATLSRATASDWAEQTREKRLIVIGGAGGARSLNEHMPQALARLRESTRRLADRPSVGRRTTAGDRSTLPCGRMSMRSWWRSSTKSHRSCSTSDLVVCRPGGTTLAELVAGRHAGRSWCRIRR